MDDRGCGETAKTDILFYLQWLTDIIEQSWMMLDERVGSATGNRTRV
jgi:hypothetical protein